MAATLTTTREPDSLDEIRLKATALTELVLPDQLAPEERADFEELLQGVRQAIGLLQPLILADATEKVSHDLEASYNAEASFNVGASYGTDASHNADAPSGIGDVIGTEDSPQKNTTAITAAGKAGMKYNKSNPQLRRELVAAVHEDISFWTVLNRMRGYEFVLLRPFLMIAVIMLLWVFAGAIVYLYTLEPPCEMVEGVEVCRAVNYAMALYYATQAGFSVGFGLFAEKRGPARWYTIFHGFIGLTIIAAGLTLFLLRPGGRLAKRISGEEEVEDKTPDDDELERVWRVLRKVKRSILAELPIVVLFLLFSLAVVFSALYNHWSFTTAVYFAFFALSTGGLQAPGSTSDAQMIFATCFLITGIPLFGAAMSRLVDLVLDLYLRAVQSSELLMSRQKHLAKLKKSNHADERVREAYEAAAAAVALAEKEQKEAKEAKDAVERAYDVAAIEAREAKQAEKAAARALELARQLEREAFLAQDNSSIDAANHV